ncbi:MAG: PKD domain-containing protein [Bacteroidetes bacterium]|nr:MAG: PKD domain-containing protein [Bacteroidota bacterium]REK35894.1 MAG: PKD domain-containing protein [Bacteroidota bacterium]REK50629.1 MAG: PKD domain-containing protein [Bacteroidota bacterium]
MALLSRTILFFFLLLSFAVKAISQCASPINAFPYSEDFESGPGGWFSNGVNDDWTYGIPAKATINSAGSGSYCWISGGTLNSFYNFGQRSWVESPCFDFSSLQFPVISLLVFWELEYQFDGGNLQYSTDRGLNWTTIGAANETDNCVNTNWYILNNITNLNGFGASNSGWTGTILPTAGSCRGGNGSAGWKQARHCITQLAGQPEVIFRFTLGSGTTCNSYDGLAFDLFEIHEASPLPQSVSYTCINSNTVRFGDNLSTCNTAWNWDFGDPASSSNSSSMRDPLHTFSSPGTYTVTMNASNTCTPAGIATIDLTILDVSQVSGPVTCNGGSDGYAEVIIANPSPGISFTWNTFPPQSGSIINGISAGQYTVIISNPSGCDNTQIISVNYGPDAFVNVDIGDTSIYCPGTSMNIYPGSFISYLWHDGSTDSLYSVTSGGILQVTVSNTSGCTGTDSLFILEDCIGDIIFPQAFSPNGDGVNDQFRVFGNLVSGFDMRIFSRWGEVVYQSSEILIPWDGTYNGKVVSSGVYVCQITYTIFGKEEQVRTEKLIVLH